jgi:hypothetical protein
MKFPHLILIAAAAFSACKRAPKEAADALPVKEVVAGVPMIDFEAKEAKFSCRAPRNWGMREKFVENSKEAVFVGESVKGSGLVYISIRRYPESEPQYDDARKYAESFWQIDPTNKQPEVTTEKIGDATVIRFHQERPYYRPHSHKLEYMNRYDYALFPIKGGFFEIEQRAPASDYAATLPVFEAVVRSFKPKS